MSLAKNLLEEFTLEAAVTRRYLASVPFDKADFRENKGRRVGEYAINARKSDKNKR